MEEHLEDAAIHERLVAMIGNDTAQVEKLLNLRALSGQKAKVAQVAEFIYPSDFNPPQVNQILTIADDYLLEILRKHGGTVASEAANRPPLKAPNAGFGNITILSPGSHTIRNVGETIEIEPFLRGDGFTVEATVAAESLRHVGEVFLGEHIQPIFETQKITTAVTAIIGRPCLLGTMSKAHQTGAPNCAATHTVSLAFLTTFME
jgi:hypothetical protein